MATTTTTNNYYYDTSSNWILSLVLILIGMMMTIGGSDAFIVPQRSMHHNCIIHSSYTTTSTFMTISKRIMTMELQMKVNNNNNNNNNENDNDNGDNKKNSIFWNGIKNLWDEIIEVSTYGPSERKLLKLQRELQRKVLLEEKEPIYYNSMERQDDNNSSSKNDVMWMEAFAAARDTTSLEYDGYALQKLLVSKFGVSLDVDFQRIGDNIYCTILPMIGYGSSSSSLRSRHMTELDYLMHLQGVVEILHKYDNLNDFVTFVETTNKVPKRGTDSVPFRLTLTQNDIDNILS